MQMHPLPLLLCSLLFNHENNLPLSLSLFFSPLSIAIEKLRAPLLSFLSKKRMDSRTCSFMEYSQERECFALIKNRMELVSIIDLESTSARLSVIIQTSIIISSWTFYRAIYYGRSPRQSFARSVSLRRFYNPGYVKNVARSFKVPSQNDHWWSKKMIREEEWKIPISIEYEILDFKGFGNLIRGIFLLVVKSREFAKRAPSTLFESLHDSTISRRLFAHERVKNIKGRGGIDFPRIAKLD